MCYHHYVCTYVIMNMLTIAYCAIAANYSILCYCYSGLLALLAIFPLLPFHVIEVISCFMG